MIEAVNIFDDATVRMLRSYIGWSIESVEGYLLAEGPDQAYKRVRLDLGGVTIDLVNEHQELCIGPGRVSDNIAVLRAEENDGAKLWAPRGKELTRRALDFYIDDILMVHDTVILSKGSIKKNKVKLVQAVIFRNGDELLAFDRDIWFDENIIVRTATVPPYAEGFITEDDIHEAALGMLRDCAGDWAEEPPYSYEFSRDLLSVTAERR